MLFQRRNSSTTSAVVAPKPNDSRLIDGSNTCSQLLTDHLEINWCATPMNTFFDRNGQLFSFLYGGILLDFIFTRHDDFFMILTTLYAPKQGGVAENLDERLQTAISAAGCGCIKLIDSDNHHSVLDVMMQEMRDSSNDVKLIQSIDGTIVMAQKVQAASLLIDEVARQTLDDYFLAARKARKAVKPAQRRRSWF